MSEPGAEVSERWVRWRRSVDLDEYDRRWEEMSARGESIHGEVDFIERVHPGRKLSILDAGCGTGRLAIEAARRGHRVVGVDLDRDMIDRARIKAPDLRWECADLSDLEIGTSFDVVVMAGNILLFCRPGSQTDIVSSLARHLVDDGALICGFSLEEGRDAYTVADFLGDADRAELSRVDLYANWDGDPFDAHATNRYVVAVCRR